MTPIHVVDDDEAMRTALARLLEAEGYEVRIYASAGEFLLRKPDSGCVVLDLQMPGPSGLELQQVVSLPIVFLTGHGDVASGVRAMKAGAVDFLTKPVEPAALLKAVEAAVARGARQAAIASVRTRFARLTARERAVFERVAAGKPNKEIARELGIAERTVKMHRAQVMEKMQAGSVADLVRAARHVEK
jgi:FixJ family two-component response regulator